MPSEQETLQALRDQHKRYLEITGGPIPATEARERTRSVLQRQRNALSVKALEESEAWLITQEDLEDKLGGRLHEGAEINDWILQSNIERREDLDRAVKYANTSGRLPEGAVAYGVEDNKGGQVIAYKMPGDNDFYHLNDPGASMADIGRYAGQLASAEVVIGTLSAVFNPFKKFQLLAQVATYGKAGKAAGAVGTAAFEGGAAAMGRLGDEMLEAASDEEMETLDELLWELLESGAFGVAGSLGGQALGGSVNIAQGRGRSLSGGAVSPEDAQAVFAAEARQGFEPLGAGDLERPIAERIQAQAGGVSESARARELRKLSAPARKLIAARAGVDDIDELSDASLLAVIKQEERLGKRILQHALKDRGINFRATPKEAGGRSVYEVVSDYRKLAGQEGDVNFGKVFDLASEQGVVFDATDVIDAAKAAIEKQRILGKAKEVAPDFTDRMLGIGPRTQSPGWMEVDNLVEGKLEGVLAQLSEMNPAQPTETLEALRRISQNLRGMASPDPGSMTRNPSQNAANKVLEAFTDMINRTSNTGDAAYRKAVGHANSHWKNSRKNLRAFGWLEDLQDELGGGERAYRRLMSGDLTMREAVFLNGHMKPKQKRQFLNSFYTDMLRNPEKISTTLTAMDVAGEKLIPKPVRQVLQSYSRHIERSNASFVTSLVKQHAEEASRLQQLVDAGKPREIRSLIASGELTPDQVSESIIHNFVSSSTEYVNGQYLISPKRYQAAYKQLKDNGILPLLNRRSKSLIEDTKLYTSFLKSGNDAGNSIAAANITSSLAKGLTDQAGAAKASVHLYQLSVMSKWAHNPRVRQALAGAITAPREHVKTRAAVLGATLYLRNLNGQEPHREDRGKWPGK